VVRETERRCSVGGGFGHSLSKMSSLRCAPANPQCPPSSMFHIVQPYGPPRDYTKAAVVASLPNADSAWEYLDSLRLRMAATGAPLDSVELVVVDDSRRPVPRPKLSIQ
jgi:hypothetical protein